MKLLDGKVIAAGIKKRLKKELDTIKRQYPSRPAPKLGSIIFGEDASTQIYAASQKRFCEEFKIDYIVKKEAKNTTEDRIAQIIYELKSQGTTAIMVNLPLPRNINHQYLINQIGPAKDAEALHPENMGKLFSGTFTISPCTAAAVMELLAHTKTRLRGKNAVIIGHSQITGKPLGIMLLNEFVTVTVCHIATKKSILRQQIENADILISAVGARNFEIKGNWIKKGAIVIDVAVKKTGNKITGDIDFDTAGKKASYITPVPGGVGPVTNAMLIKNILELYKRQI